MTEHPFEAQIDEHEAVRAAVRQLDERYGLRSREAGVGKVSGLPKDALRNLRWQLFYLLEGVTGHFLRDEAVVFPQVKPATGKPLEAEHEAIRKEAESALALITRMTEVPGTPEEAARDSGELGRMIHRLRELIETHTAREDAILRQALKDGRTASAPKGTEFQVH